VRLVLLGVRGSTPAPGAEFVRYGGHTSCVAVLADSDPVPRLVLDAGTGLRDLPGLLGDRPFEGMIALTHLHWDHVQGLPFCPSIDRPDARVELVVPAQPGGDDDARGLLARAMSPPHFPIEPQGLVGDWHFASAAPGPLIAGIALAPVAHKGGTTFGIRVELDGTSFAYLPDHALGSASVDLRTSAESLAAGVDLLLHDGQFLASEREVAGAYGHSTIDDAMRFADRCGVGELVLTHHAPTRTDAQLDAVAATMTMTPQGRPVSFARQGDTLPVAAAGLWTTADARPATSPHSSE